MIDKPYIINYFTKITWFLEIQRVKEDVFLLDYFLLPLLIVIAHTAPLVYIQYIFRAEDPLSFILEFCFKECPFYSNRGALLNLLLLLIRSVFLLGYAEVLRIWTLILIIAAVVLSNFRSCLLVLLSNKLSCRQKLYHFKKCYILYLFSAKLVMKIATLVISAMFWLCVMVIVVMVKSFQSLAIEMYVSMTIAGTIILVVVYIFLSLIAKYTDITESFVKNIQRECCKQYASSKTISSRKLWKEMKMESMTVKRLQIGYFGDLSVDKSFVASLFDNMACRVVDLLILF